MKKIALTSFAYVLLAAPLIASAQFGDLGKLFIDFRGFINDVLIPIVIGLALLAFIWGVVQYFIFGGGDEEKRKAGRQLMLWAIIGLVVFVSIWGIVSLIAGSLGIAGTDTVNVPNVPGEN